MRTDTTLEDMAKEYLHAAELQTELISQNRERLRESRRRQDIKESLKLNRLLCLLYRQRRELVEIADYLKNYYKHSSVPVKGAAV